MDSHNHVLVGFRPAKLKDDSDMTRLRGILAIDIGEHYDAADKGILPALAVIRSPGFEKLNRAILATERARWRLAAESSTIPHPTVVEQIQKKFKLGDDAAVLYAQLLALPDPTTANLRTWNDWTAARLKKAAAELVKTKLVLEAKRARAGRTVFLPGEWAELKAPWLPIESWKLPNLFDLDLDAGDPYPVGGPMVLRPFEDLFAAAWQRVVDGDEPRYEKVKRRGRT